MDAMVFLEQRKQTLGQLHRASDAVRAGELELALECPSQRRYLVSNQRYFAEDVLTGQLVQADTAARVTETNQQTDPYYMTTLEEVSRLRTGRGNVSGFEVLHPAFVKPLSERLFAALDKNTNFNSEDAFLRWLAVADFALQLLHPVKDGTGRSGEDLLAHLSAHHGYPLTFSTNGYRAALDTADRDLFHRHVTERVGFIEVMRQFFKSLGAPIKADTPWQIVDVMNALRTQTYCQKPSPECWPRDVVQNIDAYADPLIRSSIQQDDLLDENHPYHLYATFLVREITYLLLCLEDFGHQFSVLLLRYPLSMGCRVEDLKAARTNEYLPIPEPIAETTDDVMARIDLLRLGKLDQEDKDLRDGLDKIKAWNPALYELVERESQSQSMEKLLQRLRVPSGWALSPQDFRDAVDASMDWSI